MKSVQIRSFFGPYFPVFKYRKIWTRKNPYLDTFHEVHALGHTVGLLSFDQFKVLLKSFIDSQLNYYLLCGCFIPKQ